MLFGYIPAISMIEWSLRRLYLALFKDTTLGGGKRESGLRQSYPREWRRLVIGYFLFLMFGMTGLILAVIKSTSN
jgi:hypothetical protein